MSDMHGYNTTNAGHSALPLLEKFYKPGQLERINTMNDTIHPAFVF